MTIVTVVFEPELPLLRLQARSFARFLDIEVPTKIIVIDNSAKGIGSASWSRVLKEYGSFAPLVELVRAESISGMPPATGWNSQQVLKLAVARRVESDRYLTLDAKNHLIRPTGLADFEAADGRPFGNFHSYAAHPLKPSFERVLSYVGLDPSDSIDRFTATATPFVLYTGFTRQLIDDIEQRSGSTFAEEFIRAKMTEYFLYSAWLIAHGHRLEELYDPAGIQCPAVWPKGANLAGVERALAAVAEHDPAVISVHRTALARMDGAARSRLRDFWLQRKLFDSRAEVTRFVLSYRIRYLRTMAMKKVRERGLSA
jgi:hypothetical protein